MTISVIIVSWNTKQILKECITSLFDELSSLAESSEVFVVDNDSIDGSAEMIRESFPGVMLIENEDNKGFGRACNQGIRAAKGEYIFLLNPDTVVLPGAIKTLLEFARNHPKLGIVAPQLLNTDGTVQKSCRAFPSLTGMFYELIGLSRLFPNVKRFREYKMLDFDYNTVSEVDQPEGAALLIPRKVLDEVGLFDEKFFMLFEEVDLCFRIKKAGWQIWFNSTSKIIHHYGQSIKQIKPKMIVHSHKGMYYYWSKHHQEWHFQIFKPLLWVMLFCLAVIRIVLHKIG